MARARRHTLHLVIASVILVCAAPETARARITRVEITRVEITRVESPAFSGVSFDRVGPYERLIGRAYGEVDPKHALNAIIQDIELAPRNQQGLVEYSTEIDILKPVDPARGNGVLLVAFTRWVRDDVAPPASAVPRIADQTLVPPEDVRFPSIPVNTYGGASRPAVKFLRLTNPLYVPDFGPQYRAEDSTGIIVEPPRVGTRPYRLLVPQVDADGNDVAGIRSVHLQVPIGTYTGWNLFRADRFEDGFCSLQGSFIPFARTAAERASTGDARRSLEERYPSREAYVEAVRRAAQELVAQRFLLAEDAAALVAEAEKEGVRVAP